MFISSESVLLFDYFRVPYFVRGDDTSPSIAQSPAGCDWIRPTRESASSRALFYRRPGGLRNSRPGRMLSLKGSPLFCSVTPLAESRALLAGAAGVWAPEAPIVDERGSTVSAVWRDQRGSAFLPFDPREAIEAYWSESYARRDDRRGPSPKRLAMQAYYRARPLMPRSTQIALRRGFSRIQARTRFPRWPVETALHDLYDFLLGLLADIAGEALPTLGPWPVGKSWALCLTHDVETSIGYERIPLMRDLEQSLGYRSSWNLVPRRYEVDDAIVEDLRKRGFEVGVHGLYHDGRDLESERTLHERLPAIRDYARRWAAVGFRSPATHRNWDLMPLLGFDYDSSTPDTDPFEPQSGGCCTWWPFFNGELVELPITLVQDHTLFVILQRPDEQLWLEKTELLKSKSGLALLITHPDYMVDADRLSAYERFLGRYAVASDVWRALPHEITSWWRRRHRTGLERTHGGGWRPTGEAAAEVAVAMAPSTNYAA